MRVSLLVLTIGAHKMQRPLINYVCNFTPTLLSSLNIRVTDAELKQQVNDRATLVLASVAKKVRKTHPRWANDVVQRLETRLGIHGIFTIKKYFFC